MKKIFEACMQAVHYLLKICGPMDKLKTVKLIYMADKMHLLKLDRTVTDDQYFALRRGPAGSTVMDILNKDANFLSAAQRSLRDRYLQFTNGNKYNYVSASGEMDYDQLSESDKTALATVAGIFKDTTTMELVDLTHQYPEWTQFEEYLDKHRDGRMEIKPLDFYSCIPNDPLGFTPEDVRVARAFYLGMEDQLDDKDGSAN